MTTPRYDVQLSGRCLSYADDYSHHMRAGGDRWEGHAQDFQGLHYTDKFQDQGLSGILQQVASLSIEPPMDFHAMGTPQFSHRPQPTHHQSHTSGRSNCMSGESQMERFRRFDSYLLRNAPRIPESPDLSLPDKSACAGSRRPLSHILPPYFSPIHNEVVVSNPQLQQQHQAVRSSAGDDDRMFLSATSFRDQPPPPMPLFATPDQECRKSYVPTGRSLKMRKINPSYLVFS